VCQLIRSLANSVHTNGGPPPVKSLAAAAAASGRKPSCAVWIALCNGDLKCFWTCIPGVRVRVSVETRESHGSNGSHARWLHSGNRALLPSSSATSNRKTRTVHYHQFWFDRKSGDFCLQELCDTIHGGIGKKLDAREAWLHDGIESHVRPGFNLSTIVNNNTSSTPEPLRVCKIVSEPSNVQQVW
jgi:hypothetical protein